MSPTSYQTAPSRVCVAAFYSGTAGCQSLMRHKRQISVNNLSDRLSAQCAKGFPDGCPLSLIGLFLVTPQRRGRARLDVMKSQTQKRPLFRVALFDVWLREPDLNRRPSGYEPDELPDCSIPRLCVGILQRNAGLSIVNLRKVLFLQSLSDANRVRESA